MSGIPVYNQAPINAAKPSGVTPQTAVPATSTAPSQASYTPASTTANSESGYPSARPGAAAPAPTSAAGSRYAPAEAIPTPTRTTDSSLPAPPQPGAVPSLDSAVNPPTTTSRSSIPPPPKSGEVYSPPPKAQTTQKTYYPPQMAIPPPTTNAYAPPSSTTTSTTPSSSFPIAVASQSTPQQEYGAARVSLEHPPGYVQDSYAQNMSADQRRASEAVAANEGYSVGGGGTGSPRAAFGVDPDAVWESVKGWSGVVSKKLQETEAEVWKRINGAK